MLLMNVLFQHKKQYVFDKHFQWSMVDDRYYVWNLDWQLVTRSIRNSMICSHDPKRNISHDLYLMRDDLYAHCCKFCWRVLGIWWWMPYDKTMLQQFLIHFPKNNAMHVNERYFDIQNQEYLLSFIQLTKRDKAVRYAFMGFLWFCLWDFGNHTDTKNAPIITDVYGSDCFARQELKCMC